MEPKRRQNRAKIDAKNDGISSMALASIFARFLEAKVIENHLNSLPGGARERKREFSENVGFTIVKPLFSRPEASPN